MKLLVWVLLGISVLAQLDPACLPFGLRLAYGEYYTAQGGPNQLYVMFNTYGNCSSSYVGLGSVYSYNNYSCTTAFVNFTWAAPDYFNCTVYTCAISGINFVEPVLYTVYSVDSSGATYPYLNRNITTKLRSVDVNSPATQTVEPVQFVVFGDWSYYNGSAYPIPPISNCLEQLKSYELEDIQGIIFTGDQAYNLDSNNGTNYVEFLVMLEPFASVWPFIPAPGNHESIFNNSIYIYNLSYYAPNSDTTELYYTFMMGPVTFVSFDPESIVYNDPDSAATMQYLLTAFNQTFKSETTKYVIPFSHYPFVCSNTYVNPSCSQLNQSLFPILQAFYQSGKVPLYFSGHAHVYERQYPINLAGQVVDNSLLEYNNLNVPILIIEGAAGTNYAYETQTYPLQSFTAEVILATGFGVVNISSEYIGYRHIMGNNCSVGDSFALTYVSTPTPTSTFPVWAIVLLSLLGVLVLALIAWFIWWRCKSKRPRPSTADYRTFEVSTLENVV